MSQELTVQSLGDTVRDSVRKAMMDAIPDSALQSLISKEFDNFFKDTAGQYNRPDEPSPFKRMVKAEIELAMKDKIRELIKEKTSAEVTKWDGNNNVIVSTLVEEMAPAAMNSIMKSIAYTCVNNMKNNVNVF